MGNFLYAVICLWTFPAHDQAGTRNYEHIVGVLQGFNYKSINIPWSRPSPSNSNWLEHWIFKWNFSMVLHAL